MSRIKTFVLGTVVLVAILAGFYFLSHYISSTTGYAIKSDDSGLIASCLNDKQFALYTYPDCPSCDRQISEIGDLAADIEIVDCSQQSQRCLVLNELPAFEFDKGLYYGFKSFGEIRDLTRC